MRLAVKDRPERAIFVMNARVWNHCCCQHLLCRTRSHAERTVARAKTINDSKEHASTSRPSCSRIGIRIVMEELACSNSTMFGRHRRARGSSCLAICVFDHVEGGVIVRRSEGRSWIAGFGMDAMLSPQGVSQRRIKASNF